MQFINLNLQELVDCKCLRWLKPKANVLSLPLSGIYNNITISEDNTCEFLEQKFKCFDWTNNGSIGISNMFNINPHFEKIMLHETLEALIILINRSSKEIRVRDFSAEIGAVPNSKNYESFGKVFSNFVLPVGRFFAAYAKLRIDSKDKYNIVLNIKYSSPLYNDEFLKISQTHVVRTKSDKYDVEDNVVIKKLAKLFSFEPLVPFKIRYKFHVDQMEKCYLEAQLANATNYPLTITNISLTPKKKTFVNILPLNCEKFENFILSSADEYSVIFLIENPEIYLFNDAFFLNITWLNLSDNTPKIFQSIIDNKMQLYNPYYTLSLLEKPQENIVKNQSFKVVFKMVNKMMQKNEIHISIDNEGIGMSDKLGDRDVEVIDIVEKRFVLEGTMNFCLICKSSTVGVVNLPMITIKSSLSKNDFLYNQLLYFNCLEDTSSN